jgi:large conductance mechanosensitive channel
MATASTRKPDMKGLLGEFKDFINRGNVVDLAVAVLIGAAFGAVITSFTEDIFSGLLGAIGGQPSLADLSFSIGAGTIFYGKFLDSIISFLIVAAVIFAVVKALAKMQELGRKNKAAEEEAEEEEIDVLRQILVELRNDKTGSPSNGS